MTKNLEKLEIFLYKEIMEYRNSVQATFFKMVRIPSYEPTTKNCSDLVTLIAQLLAKLIIVKGFWKF